MQKYKFSSSELSFFMHLIGAKKLYGTVLDAKSVENSTTLLNQFKKRKYIISSDEGIEIDSCLRNMLDLWSHPQHGIIRLNHVRERQVVLLEKDNSFLFFMYYDDEYRMIFQDNLEQLDQYISIIADVGDVPPSLNSFNIKIACDERELLCRKNKDNTERRIYLKYGIPESWLREWRNTVLSALPNTCSEVVIFNFTEKTQCRMKIIKATDHICAYKTVYGTEPYAMIIKGGSEFVVECIYNC